MASKADFLTKVLKENTERQAARSKKLAKLEHEQQRAANALAEAEKRYQDAKKDLNAAAMIKAGTEKEQAAEVLAMFTEALEDERRHSCYSYDEINAEYHKFDDVNKKITDELNTNICSLIAEIEKLVKNAEKAADELNTVFNEISGGSSQFAPLNVGTLAANMKHTIRHTRQHFSQYWPTGENS